jgi:CelD/BcsL family acetyltransferase involved in cellulose biosynthesis
MVTMLEVTRIRDDAELAELRAEWNFLTRGVPFRSWQWLESWWEHFGHEHELYVLQVRERDGSLVGLAPWYLESPRNRLRTIRFLGSEVACTDYMTVLSTVEHEEAVARSMALWLLSAAKQSDGERSDRWDILDLDGISTDDAMMRRIAQHLNDGGCATYRRPHENTWKLQLPPSFEAYVGQLSKERRKRARRFVRQATTAGAVVHLVRDLSDLQQGWQVFVDLHQRRWQSLGQPGCFASEQFTDFLFQAAKRMLEADQLLLRWLELDGHPVAVDFNLCTADTVYAYQSGVDPDKLAYSPGNVLLMSAINEAINEGRRVIDFLRGDETYKASWGAQPFPLQRLRVVADRAAMHFRHGVWLAGMTVREWAKSGLTISGIR